MAIWTEYTTKNVPEDEDTLMIYDSSGGENKQLPVSGMSKKIVNDALKKELDIETENKTIPGAVNELHGDIEELVDETLSIAGKAADAAKTGEIKQTVEAILDGTQKAGDAKKVNGHTVNSDVPENAAFTDTVYDDTKVREDIGQLKEDISTKITKFYASNQGETHLADSDNGEIQDMMIYGKSEQKRYSGKNLLNTTLQTTTQNGVTCTNNGDGTYTLNGTATADADFTLIDFIKISESSIFGKTVKIIGCPPAGDKKTKYSFFFQRQLPPSYSPTAIDEGNGSNNVHLDESVDGRYMAWIRIISGYTCNNVLFKPMIVDASLYPDATYDDFEPYTGGQPSPSPNYPQEIKSVVNPAVKVCGKNLLNPTLNTVTDSGVTCINNGDGTYTINGTAKNDIWLKLSEPFTLSEGTYTISDGTSVLYNHFYDGNHITGGNLNSEYVTSKTGTFDLKHEFKPYISIRNGVTMDNVLFKPMVELGSTPTAYEPYHEQTVTFPYTLNSIPVSSGGNVTINGQQYIADYVDVERGKLVRMVSPVAVSDSEYVPGNNNSHQVRINKYIKNTTSDKIGIILCDKLRPASADDVWNGVADNIVSVHSGETNRLTFRCTTKANDMDSALKFIKSCKIHIVLAEPEEIDLTPEEIAAFKALATYYPVTNISVNSEQLDGYTVFNYPISMKNGWDYVKKQLNDNRDYIYNMDTKTQDIDTQAAEAYVNSEYAVALTELEV